MGIWQKLFGGDKGKVAPEVQPDNAELSPQAISILQQFLQNGDNSLCLPVDEDGKIRRVEVGCQPLTVENPEAIEEDVNSLERADFLMLVHRERSVRIYTHTDEAESFLHSLN